MMPQRKHPKRGPRPRRPTAYNPRAEAEKLNAEYARTWRERVESDRTEQWHRENPGPRKRDMKVGGVRFYKAPNTFAARLRRLGYETYRDYLRSRHWRNVKQRYRESHLPQRCFVCGDSKYELHHKTYATIGRESLDDFAPLCRGCHEAAHDLERGGESISTAPDVLRQQRRAA